MRILMWIQVIKIMRIRILMVKMYACVENLSCESLTDWLLNSLWRHMYLTEDEYRDNRALQKWSGDVKNYLDNNLYGVVGIQTRYV